MTITLSPELEASLHAAARRRGIAPDQLAEEILRERLQQPPIEPGDEWERRLLSIATDCGISLSNEAVSSEGIYE